MIMPRAAGQLLLPANPLFIAFTILLGFGWHLMPWGRQAQLPDLLALILVFWTVHQPRYVGMVMAFVAGLFVDVHYGALLGQHALAYTLLSYGAIAIHRRVLWFGPLGQIAHVLPLFFVAHAVSVFVRMMTGAVWPGWETFWAPLAQSVLWPVATVFLLAPQRRAPNPDAERPL